MRKQGLLLKCIAIICLLGLLGALMPTGVLAEGTDAWVNKMSISVARYGLRAAELNGKIYVIGGTSSSHLNTVESLDPVNYELEVKANMPTARHGMGVAAANGKIYAIGGELGTAHTNAVEEYDPVLNSWFTRAAMPTARDGLAVVTVNGKIYAIGGVNSSHAVTGVVEMYDPVANSWSSKSSLPTPRAYLAAAVVDGKIYAVGGQNSSWTTVGTVEVYDPATNAWTSKASMPTGRFELGVAAVATKLYAIGGSVGTISDFRNIVEEYNTQTNTWTTKASMPTSRTDLATVTLNNRIYAVGGYNGNSLNTVEEFFPIFNKSGYWNFAGGNANDSSGTGNNGTLCGNPVPTKITGVLDDAFTFDGQNYIQIPDNASLDAGTADFSIVCWFKSTSTKTINQLVEKRAPGGSVGYCLCLYTGRILLQLNDPTYGLYNYWGGSTAPAYNDGKWHFLAVTVDRDHTSGLKMYVDNQLIHTFNPTSRTGNLDNSAYFYIGKHETYSSSNFEGSIDEVGFFKRLISLEEIGTLYQKGYNNIIPQISFYYNMYDYGYYEKTTSGGYGSYSVIAGVTKDPTSGSVKFYYTTTSAYLQGTMSGSGNGYYTYTWSPSTWYKPTYSASGNWYMPSLEVRASNLYGSTRYGLPGYVLVGRLVDYRNTDSTFVYWDEGVNSFRNVGTGTGPVPHGTAGTYNCLAYAVGNTKNWEWPWSGTPTYTQVCDYMRNYGYPNASTSVMPYTKVIYYNGNHFAKVLTWDANGYPVKIVSKWGAWEVLESSNYNPFNSYGYGYATYFFK